MDNVIINNVIMIAYVVLIFIFTVHKPDLLATSQDTIGLLPSFQNLIRDLHFFLWPKLRFPDVLYTLAVDISAGLPFPVDRRYPLRRLKVWDF